MSQQQQRKKLICVVGATGHQGSGLVNKILSEKTEFSVRALVHNKNSQETKDLEKRGADVRKCDLGDEKCLAECFEGAYGVFALTLAFVATKEPSGEKKHAENIAKAAKQAGVSHVVFSTLESTQKPLEGIDIPKIGNYKVPHFDAKYDSNQFFKDLPTSYLYTSFYYDNFTGGLGMLKRNSDDSISLTLPIGNNKIAMVAAEDIGKAAYALFQKGNSAIGKEFYLCGSKSSGTEIAETFARVLNKKVKYNPENVDEVRKRLGDDLANMYVYFAKSENMLNQRSVEDSKKLVPDLLTFEKWATSHQQELKIQ